MVGFLAGLTEKAWNEVFHEPAFWCGYLNHVIDDGGNPDILNKFFGEDWARSPVHDRVFGEPPPETDGPLGYDPNWEFNRINLDFPRGYKINIEFFNVEGWETYFLLEGSSITKPITLGCIGGHSRMPIFRVDEIGFLMRALSPRWKHDNAVLPLLFHSMASIQEGENNDAYTERLTRAFIALDLIPQDMLDDFIPRLFQVDKKCNWREDDDLGWVNTCPTSTRNPDLYKKGEIGADSKNIFTILKNFFQSIHWISQFDLLHSAV